MEEIHAKINAFCDKRLKNETTLEDLTGKTIRHASEGDGADELFLGFEDGTYVVFVADANDDDGECFISHRTSYAGGPPLHFLLGMGVLTLEECMLLQEDIEKKQQANREARERAEFDRLKAKFEGKS